MEETISIIDFLKVLRKRWKTILLFGILCGVIGWSITHYLLTPSYKATAQMLVSQQNTQTPVDSTQLINNIDLINTYSVIIKSPIILEPVIHELGLNQTMEQIDRMIKIENHENSLVFSIAVDDSDAERAVLIANSVSEIFQREIKKILNIDNVSILSKADINKSVTNTANLKFNIAISIILGIFAGIAIALLLEFLDNTLKDSMDVEACLGLPVLGTVQSLPQKESKKTKSIYGEGETLEV